MTLVEGVRKRYTRVGPWVLDGVDLKVEQGVVTVIVAGNGVGKSTLLRIIAGAALPTAGRITELPQTVGYIPERAPAAMRMTARQYLAHVGRMRGMPPDEVLTRTNELAERLALAPGPDVPIASLSKGNGQKVAVMQAFLKPPDLLVVDEPATGLDAPAKAELARLMSEAEHNGASILLSAHESAVPAGGRMYRLLDGRLVAEAARGMRITLQPTREGLSASALGAEVLLEEPGRVTVRTEDADKLLLTALAGGWSLIEAKP
ncbi:ABC-type multidrug transport system ATPase subunit [Kibdelosporangium banguiense]|uniref:ABC-type multidrug transport system ATPase subunit n=1 Tax=Kibdelosporangium banguiense TaxID=1365924 RepID=A0ABS4TCC5_9PSEU|nr:ABC transporter ATP-binding protein [Kibdelosporangium banguiense]MBP2322080.1 ABC-type multidrug transport system ATPase subunit [Kibdelosporangium banguiense]